MSWQASCSDPSHEPWNGPLRDTLDFANADKVKHDADSHASASTAVVSDIESAD